MMWSVKTSSPARRRAAIQNGTTLVAVPIDDEVGVRDAEALARQGKEQVQRSAAISEGFTTRLKQDGTVADLQRLGGEFTTAVKARLTAPDLARVRKVYCDRLGSLKPPVAPMPTAAGRSATTCKKRSASCRRRRAISRSTPA